MWVAAVDSTAPAALNIISRSAAPCSRAAGPCRGRPCPSTDLDLDLEGEADAEPARALPSTTPSCVHHYHHPQAKCECSSLQVVRVRVGFSAWLQHALSTGHFSPAVGGLGWSVGTGTRGRKRHPCHLTLHDDTARLPRPHPNQSQQKCLTERTPSTPRRPTPCRRPPVRGAASRERGEAYISPFPTSPACPSAAQSAP